MTTSNPFPNLDGHTYMSLTTFRKSGKAVPTPVWFAQDGDTLYVTTIATSGKAKRIRNNGAVTVAPCTVRGEVLGDTVEAQARLLPPEQYATADRALTRKYGLQKRLFDLMRRFNRTRQGERTFLAITPRPEA